MTRLLIELVDNGQVLRFSVIAGSWSLDDGTVTFRDVSPPVCSSVYEPWHAEPMKRYSYAGVVRLTATDF